MPLVANIMSGGFSAGSAGAVGCTDFNTAVASAGSTQTNATAIVTDICIVTGADGTKGVRLPAVKPGESSVIFNNSGSTLKVYPPTGAAIAVPGTGLGSANAAYSHTTYATVEYFCVSSTQWIPQKSA